MRNETPMNYKRNVAMTIGASICLLVLWGCALLLELLPWKLGDRVCKA